MENLQTTEPGHLYPEWAHPPEPPLTDEERRRLRQILKDDDRASWLRKQLRVLTPWVIMVVGGVYGGLTWLSSHWK